MGFTSGFSHGQSNGSDEPNDLQGHRQESSSFNHIAWLTEAIDMTHLDQMAAAMTEEGYFSPNKRVMKSQFKLNRGMSMPPPLSSAVAKHPIVVEAMRLDKLIWHAFDSMNQHVDTQESLG